MIASRAITCSRKSKTENTCFTSSRVMTGVFAHGHSRGGVNSYSAGHCQAKQLPEIEPKVRHHTERMPLHPILIRQNCGTLPLPAVEGQVHPFREFAERALRRWCRALRVYGSENAG
jgi:hypothetical protein